jgi:hypothetical protein
MPAMRVLINRFELRGDAAYGVLSYNPRLEDEGVGR